MSRTKELHNLELPEIDTRLTELKKELMKANIQVSSGAGPSSPGRTRQIKKNIARLLTIKRKKEVRFK
ncbi:MAG: 50S ribosomal protein L29 [Candidatus Woesearchaeota archaeon]